MTVPALALEHLTKHFGATVALDDVSLERLPRAKWSAFSARTAPESPRPCASRSDYCDPRAARYE